MELGFNSRTQGFLMSAGGEHHHVMHHHSLCCCLQPLTARRPLLPVWHSATGQAILLEVLEQQQLLAERGSGRSCSRCDPLSQVATGTHLPAMPGACCSARAAVTVCTPAPAAAPPPSSHTPHSKACCTRGAWMAGGVFCLSGPAVLGAGAAGCAASWHTLGPGSAATSTPGRRTGCS